MTDIPILHRSIHVECQSSPDLSAIIRAWEISRPSEKEVNLIQLASTDVPVHEFQQLIFYVSVPLILREWIVSFRDHIIWARTSRADDLSTWTVHRTLPIEKAHENYLLMQDEREKGQDHFRRHLPLGYMTGLSMAMNFRSWVKMTKAAFEMSADASLNPDIQEIFGEFAIKMRTAVSFYEAPKGFVDQAFKSFSVVDPIVRDFSVFEDYATGAPYSFFTAGFKRIPLTLRAQLVRHRPLMVRDGLRNLLKHRDILNEPSDTPIELELACTREVAISIVKKRNCWIAQEDLWAPVVNAINSIYGLGRRPALPCDSGSCTAVRDNQLRLDGKDPAPPCPIYAKRFGAPLTPAQREAVIAYLPNRTNTREFWTEELS